MAKQRILFISQEIYPYLPANPVSMLGKALPADTHGRLYEVRTFMPKYGSVNERRNQLHEVIRLSGMNIIIDDNDHPLILKVASLQPSRIQVYFIDNDDYFQKSSEDSDPVGSNRPDNDERAIFFARGTSETVKKLRWEPHYIMCSGWITALNPLYLRRVFANDPAFENTKIIYAPLKEELKAPLDPEILRKLEEDGVPADELAPLKETNPDTNLLHKLAIMYSDGVIFSEEPSEDLKKFTEERDIPYEIIPIEDRDNNPYLDFFEALNEPAETES